MIGAVFGMNNYKWKPCEPSFFSASSPAFEFTANGKKIIEVGYMREFGGYISNSGAESSDVNDIIVALDEYDVPDDAAKAIAEHLVTHPNTLVYPWQGGDDVWHWWDYYLSQEGKPDSGLVF